VGITIGSSRRTMTRGYILFLNSSIFYLVSFILYLHRYMVMENLQHLLSGFDPDTPVYLGYKMSRYNVVSDKH